MPYSNNKLILSQTYSILPSNEWWWYSTFKNIPFTPTLGLQLRLFFWHFQVNINFLPSALSVFPWHLRVVMTTSLVMEMSWLTWPGTRVSRQITGQFTRPTSAAGRHAVRSVSQCHGSGDTPDTWRHAVRSVSHPWGSWRLNTFFPRLPLGARGWGIETQEAKQVKWVGEPLVPVTVLVPVLCFF